MRRLLILVAACSLAGCASIGGVAVPSQSAEVAIADMGTGIDASYNAAAQAYLAAAPNLPPATKAQVKALLVKAYGYVQAADTAVKLGDSTTLGEQIVAASNLITQAQSLLQTTS